MQRGKLSGTVCANWSQRVTQPVGMRCRYRNWANTVTDTRVADLLPTLRLAAASDAAAIAGIHITARREAMPYLPELHSDAETHAWVANVMLPQQEVWVIGAAGEVSAFAALHDGWLEHLYVAPASQGQGFGTRLLAQAKARCPAGLQLYAFQRNTRARDFYERRGFVAVQFGNGSDNEEGEPDVRYVWDPALP